MKISVITSDICIPNEALYISTLLDQGLDELRIRKPKFNSIQLAEFIEQIPNVFHSRIIIHGDHLSLVKKYRLKGIHLSKGLRITDLSTHKILKSAPIHFSNEIDSLPSYINTITVSPIFDSISKSGYNSKWNSTSIQKLISENQTKYNLCALGGINHHNIHKIKEMGFHQAAVLGVIWKNLKNNDQVKERYEKLRKASI